MIRKRFLFTLLTLLIIGVSAFFVVLFAKGYRISPNTGTLTGTGIISVNSEPDQASVYLDGHLTTATNDTINSLTPKKYYVRIVKEGYIPWEKEVEVREGLVTEIEATLFRSIPTIYPLTYTGVSNVLISPDSLKTAYVVTDSDQSDTLSARRAGLWVWPMAEGGIGLGRGNEPRQIGLASGLDFTKATLRWSPDSTQILASFPDRYLLYDISRFNDPPRDITALIDATLRSWDEQDRTINLSKLQTIKDVSLRKTASDSAVLKWSPDETKILYSQDGVEFKVTDLVEDKTYILPKPILFKDKDLNPKSPFEWLPDSEHLVLIESLETQTPSPRPSATPGAQLNQVPAFLLSKISVLESDGFNKSDIYVGSLDPRSVVVWPDGSRLIVVSSFPTSTASKPNLFGVNLK